jgi:hypothetical protein
MRGRIFAGRASHCLLWCGSVAIFLYSTAPNIFREVKRRPVGRIQPFQSSDLFLSSLTGLENSSQRFIDVLTSLPANKTLVIVVRERDSASSLLGLTLAYLAWPRRVQILTVSGEDAAAEALRHVPANRVAGVAFCEMKPPPWIPAGVRLGRQGRFVALADPTSVK